MLLYSVCYYYGKNKTTNHLNSFLIQDITKQMTASLLEIYLKYHHQKQIIFISK